MEDWLIMRLRRFLDSSTGWEPETWQGIEQKQIRALGLGSGSAVEFNEFDSRVWGPEKSTDREEGGASIINVRIWVKSGGGLRTR